ncbi:MAG: hypothetical protein KKE39_08885, partial [Bacteroidetes bacterium]|nr:hypothetical protein [Bacteroidota bacterium]MBU1760109.1 hypothetical protein [Bacteroidota bacterium]
PALLKAQWKALPAYPYQISPYHFGFLALFRSKITSQINPAISIIPPSHIAAHIQQKPSIFILFIIILRV